MSYCPHFGRFLLTCKRRSSIASTSEVAMPSRCAPTTSNGVVPLDKLTQALKLGREKDVEVVPYLESTGGHVEKAPEQTLLAENAAHEGRLQPIISNDRKHSADTFEEFIRFQTNDITKSEADKRSYRGLELTNGLKILLVSDPFTDKAAVSMDVCIGSMNDPPDLPGLAHFCEHMLFMGSEKYPEENDYEKFIADHGGSTNACTETDHTNYHFDIPSDYLAGALDRFAQFFISPLFVANAVEREVNAVDSEFNDKIQDDQRRLAQLYYSVISAPDHDYAKFRIGNKQTLWDDPVERGQDVREELLKFYHQYYSANLMALCVLGKENPDDLMAMVIPLVIGIGNKNVPRPEWLQHPWGPEQVGRFLLVVPVEDCRKLELRFPIPDFTKYYRTDPCDYFANLIGHEGPGSVLSELKRRNFATRLMAGEERGARGMGFFSIEIDLNDVSYITDVLEVIFAFIALLKSNVPLEWIFRENQKIYDLRFRFKSGEDSQEYASDLAGRLHDYPWEDVLKGPETISEYQPDLLEQLLELLNPRNMNLAVMSKDFADVADQTEEWYGTEYCLDDISPKLLVRFEKVSSEDFMLYLPKPNPFIPSNFELYPLEDQGKDASAKTLPQLLINDDGTRLWHKQDDEFFVPQCCVKFYFKNPALYLDRMMDTAADIYCILINDALNEFTYVATLAGLEFEISNEPSGLLLRISGYNDKQLEFLEAITQKIRDFQPDEERFETYRNGLLSQLADIPTQQSLKDAMYYLQLLFRDVVEPFEHAMERAQSCTVETVIFFAQKLFSTFFLEGLVYGNATKEIALKLADTVRKTSSDLKHQAPSTSVLQGRVISLPDSSNYVYENENSVQSNSAIGVYYQVGVPTLRQEMILELLEQMFQEPLFDRIRTKEQLGYEVMCGIQVWNGTQGVAFLVQGDHSPKYVELRIELFLAQMQEVLSRMTDTEFEDLRNATIAYKSSKVKDLADMASRFWSQIATENYNFDHTNLEIEELKKVTKGELVAFFKEYLSARAPKRKKLSVRVYSSETKDARNSPAVLEACKESQRELEGAVGDGYVFPEAIVIDDIMTFRSSHPYNPLPTPFMEVQRRKLELNG